MKLRWLLAVLVLALAPVAAMFAWQLHEDRRARVERVEEGLQHAATEFAQAVNQDIASSLDALTVLSQSEIFQQGRIAAMGRLLQGRPRRDWDSIFLLDLQGAVVLDTAARPTAPAFLRELHAQALATRAPVVSGAALQPGIAIAMPITQGADVLYVLGVRMSDALWARSAAQASPPLGGQARLYDAQGRLISQTLGLTPAGARLPQPVLAAMNGRGKGVHRSTEADGSRVIAAWDVVPLAGWHARVFVPAGPVDAAQREVLVHGLSTMGAALLAGFFLATAAGAVLIRRSRARITSNERHEPAAPEPVNNAPAQPDWGEEFVGMLAHELRNPLGTISAAVDVLESTHPTSGSAADARSVIARQARQLSHTVHGLLEASRAMAGRISVVRHPLELAALVRHVEETLAFTGESRQHALELDLEPCWVDADAVRLEQVISTLVTLAAKQAPAGTQIKVCLRAESEVVLQVVCVSQRTLDPIKGVEWALACALAHLHGGTLTAQSSETETQLELRLPKVAHPQAGEPDDRQTPVTPLGRGGNE